MTSYCSNRYPGRCFTCRTWVPADAGRIERIAGSWRVLHLGDCPQRPAREPGWREHPAETGVYRKDGRLYVVREFTPQGEDRKVRYARELVDLTPGQGDRVTEDGQAARIQEVKAPRMQWALTDADLLPMDEFKALSLRFERCLACGAHLEVKESVEAGIGPVCAGRQRLRLAASTTQAAA